uniref:Integrase, catalytic region, zinc finger, CCHC-type, peptidase aspartic, catalytic n=1 Tax=Tanacetum cinerariifolium TaxID=118510 RepID=A0A6L2L7A9_TANCI|nr:integrase, catalytic region, zinc finger, CCHC-type, peptidase aspartic, catalytic [Tanacetum cinerariifolium]
MSTQQDIYVAGSESRPLMLNKENYVPWSSRLLRYAKSRSNGKLIHNSILNGPYVRKMIPEPGDANREITTILLGLPEDIYAAVDSCETAQEIWLRVQQMMKGYDIGIQEKKAKVYFVEGLGHNLFLVRQFCDSDLEVAFRRNACFVRNLEGVDLLKGDRSTNLYTINLHEMASASPICLMARASSTKSWLWHQQLSHRNFDTINDLALNDLVAEITSSSYGFVLTNENCQYKWKANDRKDIGKLGAKGDIGFFIGCSADSCAYKIYNRRIKKIMETMNVSFDELSAMAFEQRSSKPGLQSMTSGQISSGVDLTYAPSTITTQQPSEGELDLLFEAMYDDYIGGQPSATRRTVPPAQEPQVR